MSNYIPRATRTAAEWPILADIHCATQRQFGLAVNMHGLALALNRAYCVPFATGMEYARAYVDAWLRNEQAVQP